jgi:hypothetical protein
VGGEEATVTVRILNEDATEGKGVREVEMVQEEKEARGKKNGKGSRDANNMERK